MAERTALGGKDLAKWPTVSESLLNHLDSKFPEKCVDPEETLISAQRYAGKRDLVRFLSMVREAQRSEN